MFVRRYAAGVSLFVVLILGTSGAARGEGDAFAQGLKWGLEKSVGKLAEMGYKINCKAKNLDYKSDESWYCGAFATLSGQDKKEFEERVQHQLGQIRESLARVEEGIAEILSQQESLRNQNQQILVRLDEIGPETIIGKALAEVRTTFHSQYTPLFTGERPFTGEALLALAREVVFKDKIDRQLGIINDQLTRTSFVKDTLLRSYARRMSLKMDEAKTTDIRPAYIYLESVLDDLLADERKGFLMYVWAAETLQAACEVNSAQCADFRNLPHTAVQFRGTFDKYVLAQLAELQAATEWLALARSNPHLRQPNFLHPQAEGLFYRNDLFTAGNLGKGYGIVGRVISMGAAKGFDGKLRIAGGQQSPAFQTSSVGTAGGMLDWWRATGAPGAYDELNFADQWQVYHYHLPGQGAGRYQIETNLPYRPAQVTVENVTLSEDSKVPFGSFTAIARAGGGYALLSGTWSRRETNQSQAIGDLHSLFDDRWTDFTAPYAGIRNGGTIEWKLKNVPKDQHVERDQAAYAVNAKQIRFPGGGELTLHATFGNAYPVICPNGACADFTPNQVLSRWSDFKKAPDLLNAREAEITVRSVVLIDTAPEGSNGIVFKRDSKISSGVNEYEVAKPGEEKTARIKLADGTSYGLILGGRLLLNMQTSGAADSRWLTAAIVKVDNAYLTR